MGKVSVFSFFQKQSQRVVRYVVCSLDATIWPSSTQYVLDCLDFLKNVCSLSPNNIGHVQLPLFHQATTMNAFLGHTRKLQDALLKADLEMSNQLTLMFNKDSARSTTDKRPSTQVCVTPYAGKSCRWLEGDGLLGAVLGPLPLLKVSEMEGYDLEAGLRPGAAARLEQPLNMVECIFLLVGPGFFFWGGLLFGPYWQVIRLGKELHVTARSLMDTLTAWQWANVMWWSGMIACRIRSLFVVSCF